MEYIYNCTCARACEY